MLNKAGLQSALENAFNAADGRTPSEAAALIADAIDAYVKSATVTVNAGQAFGGTSSVGPVTGTTTSTATGSLS